jgi:hypothetical protein
MQLARCLALLPLTLLLSCAADGSGDRPARMLHTSRLKEIAISPSPGWPEFFLTEGPGLFLWGNRNEVLRIEVSEVGPAVAVRVGTDLVHGLDSLVAAARNTAGTVAFLDASGRVAIHNPDSKRTWRFKTSLSNLAGGLALSTGRAYLLLRNEFGTGSAVVGYDFHGAEVGQWGEMPADGIIQANLKGGGIAACPAGSVYYSYINSPRIYRLPEGGEKEVRQIGGRPDSFTVLPARQVYKASKESMESRSVAPVVKLGLSASRVMALACSEEGLLFRQVAQPAGAGAHVEVWDPVSETMVGTIPVAEGVLLDVKNQILFLGTMPASQGFRIERIHFRVDPSRSEEAAN